MSDQLCTKTVVLLLIAARPRIESPPHSRDSQHTYIAPITIILQAHIVGFYCNLY